MQCIDSRRPSSPTLTPRAPHRPNTSYLTNPRSKPTTLLKDTHTNRHLLESKQQRSLSKVFLNRHIDQRHNHSLNQIKRCTTEEDNDQNEKEQPLRKRVKKNINCSAKAVRPSIRKDTSPRIPGVMLFGRATLQVPKVETPHLREKVLVQLQNNTHPHSGSDGGVSVLVKTKEVKTHKNQPLITLQQTIRHLVGYKIAQSKVIFQSKVEEQYPIEESIIQERRLLDNFLILKDCAANHLYSQHIAIERHLGLCLSLKRVPVSHLSLVANEQSVYERLGWRHCGILGMYQKILNGREEYLILRQHYDNHLKHEAISVGEFKRYFKRVILILEELVNKGVWYSQPLFDNLVVCRNTCKLMNFEAAYISTASTQELKVYYKHHLGVIARAMSNHTSPPSLPNSQDFLSFLSSIESSPDFYTILAHPYLNQHSHSVYLI